MKRYLRTIPVPFTIDSSGNQNGDAHFTSRGNYQILSQKNPLQAVGLLLWLEARRHLYRQEILHLSSTASPTSELSSKARLPYACLTWYTITSPSIGLRGHGTCGLNNRWHHLQMMSNRVGNPGKPPHVTPWRSAGWKKIMHLSFFLIDSCT